MSDSPDLQPLLDSWPYDPDHDARIVKCADGREVLQVRTPLGIEQLEMEGRPDGERPHDMESALEFHLARLSKAEHAGCGDGFELNEEDCAELISEGTLYYFRYLRLFQLRRWSETLRDTGRNIRLFDFVRRHAAREEDRDYLEKWRAYIVRMHASAEALMKTEQGSHQEAVRIVQAAIERIENLEPLEDETFTFECGRSLAALRELASQIQKIRPVSAVERLEQQLKLAITRQEFERAAELRDQLRELRDPQSSRN